MALQKKVREVKEISQPVPGSFTEAVTDHILEFYPLLAELDENKIRSRFFRTSQDLEKVQSIF